MLQPLFCAQQYPGNVGVSICDDKKWLCKKPAVASVKKVCKIFSEN
jgi:hypothetical protein